MDKAQLAKLDLIISTIHLLNAAHEGMVKLEHLLDADQCKVMVHTLTKDLDSVVKERWPK